MNKLKYIFALSAGLLLSACYEDKGNYDYENTIIEVPVTLQQSYGVKKEKEKFSYTITPDINVPKGYEKNLSYEWYVKTDRNSSGRGELKGTDRDFTMEIDPADPKMAYSYYIRLYVTDATTKAVTMRPTTLEVIKPYTFAWMVLHETGGHAELGSVEYMGSEIAVVPDTYTRDHGQSLTGKPLNLSCSQNRILSGYPYKHEAQSLLFLTTTNEAESGLIDQTDNFTLRNSWDMLLNAVQKEEAFDPTNIVYSGGSYGSLMTSKGKVFMHTSYTPVMYLMSQGKNLIGDYYISKLATGPHVGVGFDEIGRRFINISCQNFDYDIMYHVVPSNTPVDMGSVTPIPNNEGNAPNVDPNNLPKDQKIVALVNGYHYGKSGIAPWQRYTIYAYTLNESSQSFVYVFQCRGLTGSDPCLPYYYVFTTPDGIDENTLMTSGNSFNNVLFYAAGNKIYKLDVSTGKTTLIYQHEDPSATVADLRMACEGYSFGNQSDEVGTEDYGVPYNRCLGAAFNLPDGTGELVVLQLNTNGRILEDQTKYPSTQVHRGFGRIKNIVFI